MVSRFVVADNDVLEELKTSSEKLNTRKSTNLLVPCKIKISFHLCFQSLREIKP